MPLAFAEFRWLRAYPNNRVVMRPSEKFEAKAAGQNRRRRSQSYIEDDFDPTTQAPDFAAGRIERVIGIGS